MFRPVLGNARNARETVKAAVEGQNTINPILLHDSEMNLMPDRESAINQHNWFGILGHRAARNKEWTLDGSIRKLLIRKSFHGKCCTRPGSAFDKSLKMTITANNTRNTNDA